MITERTAERADAAASALTLLGGVAVIEQLKLLLPSAEGLAKFRVAKILLELGDPEGLKLMRDEMFNTPSLQHDAALLLATRGDLKALQYLRTYLNQRYDPTKEAIHRHADATGALIKSGDRTNAGVFQELLSTKDPILQKEVLTVISGLDFKSLLSITQPMIESTDPGVVLYACRAAVALAYPDFQKRLEEFRI
jgi:hypothetical protein